MHEVSTGYQRLPKEGFWQIPDKPAAVNAELLTQGEKFILDFSLQSMCLKENKTMTKAGIYRTNATGCVIMVLQTSSNAAVRWALPL